MRVSVDVVAVHVGMNVRMGSARLGGELFGDPARESRQIQDTEQDQHEADA